ncbi:MAG: Stealth CR1 domain-containing protein [Vitreoscilla sp.]|nr:Stealth CR1 domain-containing protein [Polaromonas sp.]
MPSDFPIDIVYLWVNGNDADWRAKRRYAAQKLSPSTLHGMALYALGACPWCCQGQGLFALVCV